MTLRSVTVEAGHLSTAQTLTPSGQAPERRSRDERRCYTLRSTLCALVAPRRWDGRRQEDRRFALLDRFDSGVALLAALMVLLSISDAAFTLTLIERGGSELNPFMNWALGHGITFFCTIKMLLTAVPVLLLVACSNVLLLGRWRGRSILGTLTGLYGGLVLYEILLLTLV